MIQKASCRPLTTEIQIQFQANPSETCGGLSDISRGLIFEVTHDRQV